MPKRDCSYTLCKGFIKEAFNKYNNIKQINFDIIDILDNCIKTSIKINGEIRTFDIVLSKKKRKINQVSMNNLKNKRKNLNNNFNSKIDDNIKNIVIISDEEKQKHINDSCSSIIIQNGKKIDIEVKNENTINKKMDLDDKEINENILNDEDKNLQDFNNIENNINKNDNLNDKNFNSEGIEYDDSEPEDWYDYNDPYFKKNPEIFKCEDCYQTNIEKKELFDYAQELIYKNNDLEDENIILKNENKEFKKMIEKDELPIDKLTKINDKFTELILITHKSFNDINEILSTLEKANPKKIPDIINKNINNYRKKFQNIADEADIIRKDFLEINKDILGNKLEFNK